MSLLRVLMMIKARIPEGGQSIEANLINLKSQINQYVRTNQYVRINQYVQYLHYWSKHERNNVYSYFNKDNISYNILIPHTHADVPLKNFQ